MYRHFQCTPLSSARFHLMWGLEPKEEEKKSITSTLCPTSCHDDEVEEEENSSMHSLCRALLGVLPHQPPPSISAPFFACGGCLCVQKESESSTRPIIHSEFGFLLPGVPFNGAKLASGVGSCGVTSDLPVGATSS